ncbi:response regulator [Pseudoalteromonas luteoviolacea]|uniref:response regulator n=1 Tax=Pseudoalteromonas TaxID=53246 RepID=UPI001B39F6B1|nr:MULTISPECIES: response regulator [Pseudoalteromonas]MBQ4879839.1 response regulator [Pseudoalteromonas luteoviolacea]MBQ4908857.1 response regulator [Pseudoalteromonas luteoviolacea]MDK1286472.1 response regulator [Pseudoalteromonas sp. B95]
MNKILIVDDDDFALEYQINTLSGHYEIETASSGEAALESVNIFQPDLVIMDIQMPGISGYEATYSIRQAGHQIPILFLSNLCSIEERLKAYDSGGNDFIAKPAEPTELIKKINTLLSYAQQTSSDADEIAIQALSDIASLGTIIQFYKQTQQCRTFSQLANAIFHTTRSFGLRTSLTFRVNREEIVFFDNKILNNIDVSLLSSLKSAKRIMEFGSNRAAFNWQYCSLLVKNMPSNHSKSGVMKDYLAYLMDGIESCIIRIMTEISLNNALTNYKDKNAAIKSGVVNIIDNLESELNQVFATFELGHELSQQTETQLLALIERAQKNADSLMETSYEIESELQDILEHINDAARDV